MLTEEIRTPSGRPVALIVPFPFPKALLTGSEAGVIRAATSFGFPFVVILTRDEVIGRDAQNTTIFEFKLEELAGYARTPDALQNGLLEDYALVGSRWLADVQWRARSKGVTAPAEGHLPPAFLDVLRSEELHASL